MDWIFFTIDFPIKLGKIVNMKIIFLDFGFYHDQEMYKIRSFNR